MDGLDLFIPITKVDESRRLVYGIVAEEVVDHSGEVFDYESSKPHFQKWSEDAFRTSGGKSKGNLRTMHGKVAAGKLTDLAFDDNARRVSCVAKVVDDGEWKKVLEGVYTGFSMGGRYGDRKAEKMDGRDVTKYTAIPSEVSLVDKPCIPTATFQLIKADGQTEDRVFKAFDESKVNRHPAGSPSGGQFSSGDSSIHEGTNYKDFESLDNALNEEIERKIKRDGFDVDTVVSNTKKEIDSINKEIEALNASGKDPEGKTADFHRRRIRFHELLIDRVNSRYTEGSYRIDREAGWRKMDGSNDMDPTNEEIVAKATEMAKASGGDGSGWADFMDAARDELTKAKKDEPVGRPGPPLETEEEGKDPPPATVEEEGKDPPPATVEEDSEDEEDEEGEKKMPEKGKKAEKSAGIEQVWKASDGKTFMKKADALEHQAKLDAPESELLKGLRELASVSSDSVAFEPNADVEKFLGVLTTEPLMAKSLASISRMADALRCVASLQLYVAREAEKEGDGSTIPDEIKKVSRDMADILVKMAEEETRELLVTLNTGPTPDDYYGEYMELAAPVLGLAKADLEKFVSDELQKRAPVEIVKEDEQVLQKVDALESELALIKGELATRDAIIAEATTLVKSVREEMEAMKRRPMPAPPRTSIVVEKGDDGKVSEADKSSTLVDLSKLTSEELANVAIRMAQRNGARIG